MNEFENIGARLTKLREWKSEQMGEKLTHKRISELTGLGDRHYQTLESGKSNSFTVSTLAKIQKLYQCNLDWLFTGKGQPYDVPMEKLPVYTGEKPPFIHTQLLVKSETEPYGGMAEFFDTVPMAETKLNAGGGHVVESETFAERFAFRKSWLRRIATSRENAILMMVEGDSMEPVISDGDMVMIDRGRINIAPGKIYAIGVSETIMIKRLELIPENKVRVISDNKYYHPYIMDGKELRVIGQVIWFAREMVRIDNGAA